MEGVLSGDYGPVSLESGVNQFVGDHLMDFSFLRALRASVRLNLNTLLKDAKRLQRASGDVFGQTFPLSACQEAYARARGFRSWHEAQTLLERVSRSGSTAPFWTIGSRNDVHQAVFSAIAAAELEMSENGPVTFLGPQADAALPAACLWFEMMSAAGVPGLMLVDTKAPSLQDTGLGRAIGQLGLGEIIDHCRFIDLRETHQPIALGTSVRDWTTSLMNALPEATCEKLERSGMRHLVEVTLDAVAKQRSCAEYSVFFDSVETVVKAVCSSKPFIPLQLRDLDSDVGRSLSLDLKRYIDDREDEAAEQLRSLVRTIGKKRMRLGTVIATETTRRPTVVLFDRDDPASVALAGVVHSLYYWRYVGMELRKRGISTRPVLYYSDREVPHYPDLLMECGANYTCVVIGEEREAAAAWDDLRSSGTLLVQVEHGSMVYSGRRVPLPAIAGGI